MSEIRTAGDLRLGVAHLADDEPIEFWINNVSTKARFQGPGIGGDAANIDVEPNYTCKPHT